MTEDMITLNAPIPATGRNRTGTGFFTFGLVCGLVSGFVALLLSA